MLCQHDGLFSLLSLRFSRCATRGKRKKQPRKRGHHDKGTARSCDLREQEEHPRNKSQRARKHFGTPQEQRQPSMYPLRILLCIPYLYSVILTSQSDALAIG